MPTLRRLSDADPTALTAALEAVWADGDAAIVLPPDLPPAAMPAAVRAALAGEVTVPDGTALVVPTSGSTGEPRAVVVPHAALRWSIAATLDRLACRDGETWALALPVRHVAGLMVLLRSAALGSAPVVVTDPGDPLAIAGSAREAAHVALVPTQVGRALEAGVDLTGFRTVLVGGGPAADGLVERARAAGVRVITSYGMTETCGGCVHDGLPLDGVEVDVDVDGRIRLRGPCAVDRTLDGTPLQDADGWFVTADHGRIVAGRLEVLGRLDDVIVSGGANLDPVAIAAALRSHPAVADVVVVAVPDRDLGRAARAVVVPAGTVELRSLREHVTARLGRMHAPRELLVVDRIPRDGMGKIGAPTRADLAAAVPTEVYSPA